MNCCFVRRTKSEKPINQVSKPSEDHVQPPGSQTGLPRNSTISGETAAVTSDELFPSSAQPNQLQHSDSVRTPKTAATIDQQGSLPPEGAILSMPVANKPNEAVPAVAEQSRVLWDEAFARLDQKKKDLFSNITEPQGPEVMDEIEEQIKALYRDHQVRESRINRVESKSDIMLAAAKKILSSVLWFKNLVDGIVACDPSGHASTAWAIISLGLKMVENNTKRLESLVEACGTLIESHRVCAATELAYRDRDSCQSYELEEAIIGVYLAILDLSAEIFREHEMSSSQKIVSSITALTEQRIHELVETLSYKAKILRRWECIIHDRYGVRKLREIEETVASTLAGIERLTQQVSNIDTMRSATEEQSILDWLSKYSFSKSHEFAKLKREPQTGAWIFESPKYQKRKKLDHPILGQGTRFRGSALLSNRARHLPRPASSVPRWPGVWLAYYS